jgi:hypothetical protein
MTAATALLPQHAALVEGSGMGAEVSPSRAVYVKVITAAWQKIATEIIEVGRCLVQAKAELHGEFTTMLSELPFGPRTAQRLMAIARNPTLANPTHASLLPTSWMTLYELARLPEPVLVLSAARAAFDGIEQERRKRALTEAQAMNVHALRRKYEELATLIALPGSTDGAGPEAA